MGTGLSEEPTAVRFRVEEKCMEPAGTSERSVLKHHTAGRYVPEADVKNRSILCMQAVFTEFTIRCYRPT